MFRSLGVMASIAARYLRRERRAVLAISTIATGIALLLVSSLLSTIIIDQSRFLAIAYSFDAAQLVRAATALSLVAVLVGAAETGVVMSRVVLSRIKSVGVMRATGIGNSRVFSLFLLEAAFYGIIGGAIGIMVGAGIATASVIVSLGSGALTAVLSPLPLVAAEGLGLSVLVSVLAAIFPTAKAVYMRIISAIYYE